MAVHYYPYINKIINQLNLRDNVLSALAAKSSEAFIKPFVTIAREPGSGGAPIARAIAAALGFDYVDEQIIEEIANSTRQRAAIIKAVDEKHRTAIQDIVHSLLNKDYIDDVKYISELVKVVLAYADRGHCVILGRGGNFITPFAKGLHVLVTAPYDVRVQRAMDFEGLSREKAKKIIAEVEQERRDFVKQYFRQDHNKINAYDLVINTTFFRVDEARDVIIEAFYRKFSRLTRYSAILKK